MYILGLSAYYHDSAACLLQDGQIIAAAQEERFTRLKHDPSFPSHAVNFCLDYAGISNQQLDYVVFYDKPLLKLERLLETYLAFAPQGLTSFLSALPPTLKQKIWIKDIISKKIGNQTPILFSEHHLSHAASAFYPSPYKEAAFLTIDGVGEWTTTSYGVGHDNNLKIIADLNFPHSLGLLYSAFTYYCGFKVNSGEYKLMGLAPYGEPRYTKLFYDHLIDLKPDGSFRLNLEYFSFCTGLKMTSKKFNNLFNHPPRQPESPLTQFYMDVARSIQSVTEDIMLRLARHIYSATGQKKLCLAGGVALNCVANGRILREGPFDNIWIQPAAGDAGGAIGAALIGWYRYLNNPRTIHHQNDSMSGALLGPSFTDQDIEKFLQDQNITFTKLSTKHTPRLAARLIADGKIIGWFQNRMEFGPRALGARSILGDARSPDMQKKMNLKIKFRESFRPFAPSVLADQAPHFFDINTSSPYMLLTVYVSKLSRRLLSNKDLNKTGLDKLSVQRTEIPAITHVDFSARLHTETGKHNFFYFELLKHFYDITGCPIIINTSFNVRGEPIVCTPEDAYNCFMHTNIDHLFLGPYLVSKDKNKPQINTANHEEFPPD